jgi:arginase
LKLRSGRDLLRTHIIQVPYDSGRRDFRMGNGPSRLLEAGFASPEEVFVEKVVVEELPFELGTTFRVLRSLSERVKASTRNNCLPLVLAGGCISCVGTLSGLSPQPIAVVWMDAHADFNTPETTVSGFIDGMALAAATGRCWRNLTSSISGFQPVSERNVILMGARDLDQDERRLLERSDISWVDTATIRDRGLENAIGAALGKVAPERVYLHVDLDVLDRSEAGVNEFSSAGGLTVAELLRAVEVIAHSRSIVAAAITAYDPSYDTDGKALRAAQQLVKELQTVAGIAVS